MSALNLKSYNQYYFSCDEQIPNRRDFIDTITNHHPLRMG